MSKVLTQINEGMEEEEWILYEYGISYVVVWMILLMC